jgi:hypothetical protein
MTGDNNCNNQLKNEFITINIHEWLMRRLFLPFNKTIIKVNLIFSVFLTILSVLMFFSEFPSGNIIHILLLSFIIIFLTGGFLLSFFYFELSRKNEYYFYYNMGITKIKLLIMAYMLHLIFIIPLVVIIYYV